VRFVVVAFAVIVWRLLTLFPYFLFRVVICLLFVVRCVLLSLPPSFVACHLLVVVMLVVCSLLVPLSLVVCC